MFDQDKYQRRLWNSPSPLSKGRSARRQRAATASLCLMKWPLTPLSILSNDALFRICFMESWVDVVMGKWLEEERLLDRELGEMSLRSMVWKRICKEEKGWPGRKYVGGSFSWSGEWGTETSWGTRQRSWMCLLGKDAKRSPVRWAGWERHTVPAHKYRRGRWPVAGSGSLESEIILKEVFGLEKPKALSC